MINFQLSLIDSNKMNFTAKTLQQNISLDFYLFFYGN